MRTTTIRWLVTAAACIPALVLFCGSAAAATGSQGRLLARYQPVTVLDTQESFAPTSAMSFITDASLETQTAPNTWALVTSTPTSTDLPTAPTATCLAQALVPCYRLNQRDCSPAVGLPAVACYQADWLSPRPRSIAYGRAFSTNDATVLQYWYFYYNDFYSYHYPPDDFIWQAHEGDWEAVTVLVPHHATHPSWVGYSQHCTGQRERWHDVSRWHHTTHPTVYVSIGSHANFFRPGDHPIATQCIPPQAIQFLQQAGLPLPVDYSHPGPAYGPETAGGVRTTGLVRVTATSPQWMRFIGTWGEYQYFHGPSPINTVASGFSPPSPPLSTTWQHPISTLFSWPRTG